MNNLSKTLLGGVAVAALAAPAVAAPKHPAMHVTALHAGKAVNKTKIQNQGATHVTYTFGVYTYVSASSAGTTVNLAGTFYKWNSNGTLCSMPKMKISAPSKTKLAKIGTASETYSLGCASGPTTFLGDTYTLKKAKTGSDSFVSTLIGHYKNGSTKYKGTLNLDVSVTID